MDRIIKAVLFDLDGTLVDSLEDLAYCMNHALKQHGYRENKLADYRRYVGDGVRKLVERALPEEGRMPEEIKRVQESYRALYDRNYLKYTKPYPGIAALLQELRQRGVALAVVTNKPDAVSRLILAEFFGTETFSAVLGSGLGFPHKPDPSGALHVAEKLGMLPESCLFAGDSDVDMVTGNCAGMTAVGVGWGFRGETELIESGAAYVIHQPDELLRLLCMEGLQK